MDNDDYMKTISKDKLMEWEGELVDWNPRKYSRLVSIVSKEA